MNFSHETIFDDDLIQLYFCYINTSDELLPAHWHEHLELLFILEGTMTAYVNDSSYCLQKGDALLVNPRDIHYTHSHHDCQYCLLQIPPAHLARLSHEWEGLRFTEYLPHSPQKESLNFRLTEIFHEMYRLHEETSEGNHLLFLTQLYRLLYLLYTEASRTVSPRILNRSRRDLERVEQSMEYVKDHYRENLTLSQAAQQLSVTPEHFCRLFKKYTGHTFFTYVNQIRLMHFYQELLTSDESITFLMDRHGITNYKVFLKTFKEAYGTTPQRLRKERRHP